MIAESEKLFLLTGPGNISSRLREGLMSPHPFLRNYWQLMVTGGWVVFSLVI